MKRITFVGECRSITAIAKGLTWRDGGLAAKPLFEALRSFGVEPLEHRFVNLFRDPPAIRQLDTQTFAHLLRLEKGRRRLVMSNRTDEHRHVIVAMGSLVSRELLKFEIDHVAIVHPAARGRIRKRARYIAHVRKHLESVVSA